jgi:hypothetical protein
MEHQGIEYTVVQTINPPGWKWSFERAGRSSRTGIGFNRAEAIIAAQRAIIQWLRKSSFNRIRSVCDLPILVSSLTSGVTSRCRRGTAQGGSHDWRQDEQL